MLHKLTMYIIQNGREGEKKPTKAVTFCSSCNLMGESILGKEGDEGGGGLHTRYLVKLSSVNRSKQYFINNSP